jgi:acyl-CoA thioester hydrolase
MRYVVPADKKLTLELRIPIRWGDMDAMGHVNNTLYFRYLESARVDWLCAIGARPDPSGVGPVIVNAFCNFYRQLKHPGDLIAKHYVSDPGRSSFETWITLERVDEPGVISAEGGTTTVWFDAATGRSVPLPDWVRELVS